MTPTEPQAAPIRRHAWINVRHEYGEGNTCIHCGERRRHRPKRPCAREPQPSYAGLHAERDTLLAAIREWRDADAALSAVVDAMRFDQYDALSNTLDKAEQRLIELAGDAS